MKGLSTTIKALIAVVIVLALVVVIYKGSQAVINVIEYKTSNIETNINTTLVPENFKIFCQIECKHCCMIAEGTTDQRSEICNNVLANKFYLIGNETVPCNPTFTCNC